MNNNIIPGNSTVTPVRMAEHGRSSSIWTKFAKPRNYAFQLHLKYIKQPSTGFWAAGARCRTWTAALCLTRRNTTWDEHLLTYLISPILPSVILRRSYDYTWQLTKHQWLVNWGVRSEYIGSTTFHEQQHHTGQLRITSRLPRPSYN